MEYEGPQNTGETGNQRKNRNQSDQNIVEVGYNTQKNPKDLSRLTIIQTPVRNSEKKKKKKKGEDSISTRKTERMLKSNSSLIYKDPN